MTDYRLQVRETLQGLSDQALEFQALRAVGGIDAEEIAREQARRAAVVTEIPFCGCTNTQLERHGCTCGMAVV